MPPNTFTTQTNIGFISRMGKSLVGALLGIVFILAAFVILYTNEGRKDLSLVASQSQSIDSSQITTDSHLQASLVSVTGPLNAGQQIGDTLYIKPGNYIALNRITEMYSWIEKKQTQSHNNVGGSQSNTTTYTYSQGWTESARSSETFAQPDGHQNPAKKVSNAELRATGLHVGVYSLDESSIILPEGSAILLNSTNTTLSKDAVLASDMYVFLPASSGDTLDNPKIGDMRIHYTALNVGIAVTVFGKLAGSSIAPYIDLKSNQFYRAFNGTRDQAIAELHKEYTTSKWLLRVVGLVLMFIGFMMVANPVVTVLSVLPIAGSIGSGLVFLLALVLSVVLSVMTIVFSMILHSVIAVIFAAIIIVLIAFLWLKKRPPYSDGRAKTSSPIS